MTDPHSNYVCIVCIYIIHINLTIAYAKTDVGTGKKNLSKIHYYADNLTVNFLNLQKLKSQDFPLLGLFTEGYHGAF